MKRRANREAGSRRCSPARRLLLGSFAPFNETQPSSISVNLTINSSSGPALLSLGFRPFFFLAGAHALMMMALWMYDYVTGMTLATYYGPVLWHSHGMLFGYAAAVIAGFLLTAVPNWTGLPATRGAALALLAAVWLAGRAAAFLASDDADYITGAILPVDGAFRFKDLRAENLVPTKSSN